MSAELNVTEAPETRMEMGSGDESGEAAQGGPGGYELDENGQRVSHGMGQSKSSRRRRRKRKNKTSDQAAGTAVQAGSQTGSQTGGSNGEGAMDAVVAGVLQPIPVLPGESLAMAQQGNGHGRGQQYGQQTGSYGGAVRTMQANGQAPQQQNGAIEPGTKRWKKKFRERDRQRGPGMMANGQPQGTANGNGGMSGGGFSGGGGFRPQQEFRGPDTHQPGNNASGGKRKGGFGQGGGKQQRSGGARGGFVGPMDHSYRPVNGNVFDPSPAGDSFSGGGARSRGGYHSDAQPIDYSQGRAIPIAADAPTRIYFFIEDLFFTAKIQETARKLGVKVAFIKNEKEQIAALTAGEEEDRPGLIVFDLNNANAKPLTLIPKLKTKLKKHTSIVGFLSHLQGDLKAKAVEAGCDTVMPRAAFSQNLPNLLRRYGIEEVDEPNYNQ